MRIYIYLAIFAVLTASFAGVYVSGRIHANNACESKYESAALKHQKQAQQEIRKIQNSYEEKRNEITSKQDSGYGVGPFVADVLDSL